MATLETWVTTLGSWLWGEFVLIPLLTAVGVYLTIGLRALPWRYLWFAFSLLFERKPRSAEGEITPFQALMTALAATVGTGNIAGVATAIYLGGPGALFWMWVIALFGMATKYSEAVLAVHFRRTDANGQTVGGPMYYIQYGLGQRWQWLASAFAIFGMIAAFGIGNMVQSNSVADVLSTQYDIPMALSGGTLALIAGIVIIGGVRRIAAFASRLVPLMAITYFFAALAVLATHASAIPAALSEIFYAAFHGSAAAGGAAGASVWMAIRFGVARGIFSNESGLGSAAIAHAAARTNSSVRQGMIAMLGTFIDTMIMCTLTGLVIMVTNAWQSGEQGAGMSSVAFEAGLGGAGGHIVSLALSVFAFTTIVGWSYYGERCATYLFGTVITPFYRILWVIAIAFGAVFKLKLVWDFADLFNGLMALPNLIALCLLSPLIFAETRKYLANKQAQTKLGIEN